MKITEIYKKFGIPPNLAEHMFRVFGVVSVIQNHWKSAEFVDWDLAKKMALLHDLGNVVKMDNINHPEFLGEEQVNIDYWNKKQKEMIEKYGDDDNNATRKMLLEIGLDTKTADLIFNKRFINSVHTKNSNDWALKIMYYADLRVLPLGIGTLKARLDDIRKRYTNFVVRTDFEELVNACYEIEVKIQVNLDFDVNKINDELVNNELLSSRELVKKMEV